MASHSLDTVGGRAWPMFLRRVGRWLLRLPCSLAWAPALAWAVLIFALSSFRAPLGDLPSSIWAALFGNLAHAFEFGVLLLLLVPLLPRSEDWVVWSPLTAKLLPSLAFLYAVSDEFHQSLVPGRDASLLDLGTDLAGILSVYWVVRRLQNEDLQTSALKGMLLRALLVCIACAGSATLWGVLYEEGPWPFGS